MSSLHSLIANGGTVLVVGGLNKVWEDYRDNPQLRFWTGDNNEIQRQIKANDNRLPDNTRAVILSRFLSHQQKRPLLDDARRRRAIIFDNRNEVEIRKTLDEILTFDTKNQSAPEPTSTAPNVPAAPTPQINQERGWLTKFVELNIRAEGSHVEEARRLMLIIKAKGFKTTIDSLTNQVGVTRRKLNLGPSKRKTKVNDQSVSILQPTLSQPTEQSTKTVTSPKIGLSRHATDCRRKKYRCSCRPAAHPWQPRLTGCGQGDRLR